MKKKIGIKRLFSIIAYSLLVIILSLVCLSIIFYASGYRLNPKSKRIEKTGMLIIDYKQEGLKVFLDNKEIDIKKSSLFSISSAKYAASVLPGEYDMELKKDGKAPYKEHISIQKELITRIDNLILLPEQIKTENILSGALNSYKVSPDNKKIVYQKKDSGISIYDLETKKDSATDSSIPSVTVNSFSWSNDSKKIIVKYTKNDKNDYFILEPSDSPTSYKLQEQPKITASFENIFFSPKNSNDILGMLDGKLYKINGDPIDKNVLEEGIDFIIQRNDNIYYHETKNNQLLELDTAIYSKSTILENFKPAEDFDIFVLNGKNVYIKNDGNLYFIRDKNNIDVIDKGIENALISSGVDNLYYTRGYEVLDLRSGKTVFRLSKNISHLHEFYKNLYFIYQSGSELSLISKDGKSDRPIITAKGYFEMAEVLDKNKILTIQKKDSGELEFDIVDLEIEQ